MIIPVTIPVAGKEGVEEGREAVLPCVTPLPDEAYRGEVVKVSVRRCGKEV